MLRVTLSVDRKRARRNRRAAIRVSHCHAMAIERDRHISELFGGHRFRFHVPGDRNPLALQVIVTREVGVFCLSHTLRQPPEANVEITVFPLCPDTVDQLLMDTTTTGQRSAIW